MVVGALSEDSNATGVNGNQSDNSADGSSAVYVFDLLHPEIAVEQPAGTELVHGAASINFGSVKQSSTADFAFTRTSATLI